MSPEPSSIPMERPQLAWHQMLQVKLGLMFLLFAAGLGVLVFLLGRLLIAEPLQGEVQRYQRESGLRLVQLIEQRLAQAEALARAVGRLRSTPAAQAPGTGIPTLVADAGLGTLVAGVGLWPEAQPAPATRRSEFWIADADGALQRREDYNDPRAIAYWEESWYTPARYAVPGRCFWTIAFREPLARREVVACVLPLRDGDRFAGAVTVLLAVGGLQDLLQTATADQTGYALLADRDERLLAISDRLQARAGDAAPRSVAALAQQEPSLNAIALDLHRRNEAFLSRAAQSPRYDSAAISALAASTREGSRQDASSALALIWNTQEETAPAQPANAGELAIARDALLDGPSAAAVFELAAPSWKLVRVTPAREGMAGAQRAFDTSVLILGLGVIGSLGLAYGALHWIVLRPLRRIADGISDARSVDQALHLRLDTSAHSEIGVIAHWYNQRIRQLREAMDRTLSQQAELAAQASDRHRSDEQALRLRERAAALLASVTDAVIVIDARGQVEDMNEVAERLSGGSLSTARGKALAEVLALRLQAQGSGQSDLAAITLTAGERIDYREGLFLVAEGRPDRELHLLASPLRGPSGRVLGAVLVFRPRESQASAPRLLIDRRSVDSLTALPTRAACDRRLRVLLDSTRLQTRAHAVLVADVDHLRSLNDSAGQRAGDEWLVRVAQVLVAGSAAAEVFRLVGDAFAILLEATDAEGAQRLAESLRARIAAMRLPYEDRSLSLTASFGLVLFDRATDQPSELLRKASDACAAAKRAGRNRVLMHEAAMDRDPALNDEPLWIRRIRAGLDENLLHLTTQWIQTADRVQSEGAVFEMSVALETEEGFRSEPSAFLPTAERCGLVAEIERWTLRQTLAHLGRSPDLVARLAYCCLPLSAQTVSEGATLELLAQSLQQYRHVPPSKLCFMLRESALAEAPGPTQALCEAMRSLGARVAIDHFGSCGIGSLESMRRLPAEILRVDARQFTDLGGDAVDQLIADSLVRLSRVLARRLLVMEISDSASAEAWRRLGADYLHGNAVARSSSALFAAR